MSTHRCTEVLLPLQFQRSKYMPGFTKFDFAFSNSFDHTPDPEKFLAEMQRVLKPGGILMIRCPNLGKMIACDILGSRI